MKNVRLLGALLVIGSLLMPPAFAYAAEEGTWSLSDDGKYWMYFSSPGEPVKDAWIEEDGREYYLDSKGYMKKGWVTDKSDGNRYYMGEDGAKSFHTFTPDGHYIDGDGVVLEAFDTYRKAIKKPLNKLMKAKEYKGLDTELLPVFSLVDMNGDGFRDLVVYDSAKEPRRLLLAALWDSQEEELQVTAESDGAGGDSLFAGLTCHGDSQTVWLTMKHENGWDRDYFSVGSRSPQFEHIWKFTVEINDWGDYEFYCNGDQMTEEEWNSAIKEADMETGVPLECQYLPLTEESIITAVDSAPSAEEMPLWQS